MSQSEEKNDQAFKLISDIMEILGGARKSLGKEYHPVLNKIAEACNDLEKKAGGRRRYPCEEWVEKKKRVEGK